jgi:hypothetical protein
MALKNKSEVNMIQGPEFINLQPLEINPLMQKCEIKVFYLGHNRNGSYIDRDTASQMAKTLRGTPIVAAFNKDKGDFGDHGHIMHIEDGEVTFTVKTIPYGFVSPDAEVWFQNFTDTDEFSNQVERTYLMTTGYLWSGQFEELAKVINEGQPQSMELDANSLQGHWATDNNLGVDFFIINDATFSKLCILGDNVEPCYEGASVTSPEVSKNFSYSENFQQTLFSMMNDLQTALNSKGGLDMSENETLNESVEVDETAEVPSAENEEFAAEEVENVVAAETDDISTVEETVEETAEFVDKKDDEEDANEPADSDDKDEDDADDDNDDKKKPSNQHSLEEFEALQAEIDSLRAENEELRNFKLTIENQQKDALIASYHMLSDEDKAEVIAHKSEYSLDDIKAKLAVIYVEKNVNFDMIDGQEEVEETTPAMTFSLDEEASEGVPAFIEALRHTSK